MDAYSNNQRVLILVVVEIGLGGLVRENYTTIVGMS